jgi:AraC-like DNA-binding protein
MRGLRSGGLAVKWLRYVSVFGVRSLLSKLVISYSVILLAFAAVAFVGLRKVGDLIRTREQRTSEAYLDRAFELVDVELDHLVDAAYGVVLTGENRQRLAASEHEVYPRLQLSTSLARFRSAFPLVSECYLYRAGLEFVIGCDGTEPRSQAFEGLLQASKGAQSSITSVRDTGRFRVLAVAEQQPEGGGVSRQDWLVLVARSGTDLSPVTLLVVVDEKSLRTILARTPGTQYGRTCVVDSRGRLISASDGAGIGTFIDPRLHARLESAERTSSFDHNSALVVFRRSYFFDGFYFAEVPYALLFRPLRALQYWLFFAGLCLAAGHVLVSAGFAAMIYSPVARLVDEVASENPARSLASDEVGTVKEALHTIAVREAIGDLLESGESGEAGKTVLDALPYQRLKVAVVRTTDARLACSITERFFAEKGGPAARWASTLSGRSGQCCVIVNGPQIEDGLVRSTFEQLIPVAASRDCVMFVGIGRTVTGLGRIEESLRSAIVAIAQGRSGSQGGVFAIDDAVPDAARMDFPADIESVLAAAISSASRDRVEAVLREVFRRNVGVPNAYLTMIGRELLTVYARLSRGGLASRQVEAIGRIVEDELAVDRLESTFVDLFAGLVPLEPRRDGRGRHVSELAMRLIEHRFMRPDLCGQSIADSLGLSPSHLSSVFKSTTGVGLADYLAEYRFQKAKDLLVGTNETIKEIAHGVGFALENSFVRAFRRSVGVSPGEYRRLKASSGILSETPTRLT